MTRVLSRVVTRVERANLNAQRLSVASEVGLTHTRKRLFKAASRLSERVDNTRAARFCKPCVTAGHFLTSPDFRAFSFFESGHFAQTGATSSFGGRFF